MVKPLLLLAALSPMTGGWSPIKNPTDQHVKDLGAFAVSEHNKVAKDSLEFMPVVKEEQQVVTGMNSWLVLHAKKPISS